MELQSPHQQMGISQEEYSKLNTQMILHSCHLSTSVRLGRWIDAQTGGDNLNVDFLR